MLTIAVRVEQNAFDADIDLSVVFLKHEVFSDTNFPR